MAKLIGLVAAAAVTFAACKARPERRKAECRVSYDAGTYTLHVRENGVERVPAKTAPMPKEELAEWKDVTCGPKGEEAPCDYAAYVRNKKTEEWSSYIHGAKDANDGLVADLFHDFPVTFGKRIVGTEANPCRIGPGDVFDVTSEVDSEQKKALRATTFAMTYSGKSLFVAGNRLAAALAEGAMMEWFTPAPVERVKVGAEGPKTEVSVDLIGVGKVVAWAVGVIGGLAAMWARWGPGLRRKARVRKLRQGKLVKNPKLGEIREVYEKYGGEALHPEIRDSMKKIFDVMNRLR